MNAKNLFFHSIGLTTILFFINGCGTSIVIEDYTKVNIEKSAVIPSKDVFQNYSKPKLVVFDFDDKNIETSVQAHLGSSIASYLNGKLSVNNIVQVISRTNNNNQSKEQLIKTEVLAKEKSIELDNSDVGQVDYIIDGEISNASYTYQFYDETKLVVGGKTIIFPPKYVHTACVTGTSKIYSLPDKVSQKTVAFKDCKNNNVEVNPLIPYTWKPIIKDDGLVRQAGENAIETAYYELMNFFSKKGYISEVREDDGEFIIKTTLTNNDGVQEGNDIDIYTIENTANPFTNETSNEEIKIGQGVISNQISTSSTWIKVKNLDKSRKIKFGDFVKVHYEESFMNKILK